MVVWWLTNEVLEQQKMSLVSQYNMIQKEIDDRWLLDIAYDSWPFKDLITKRESIKREIDMINNLLNCD